MAVNECDFVPAWLFIVMNGCLTVINGSLTLIRLLVAYQKKQCLSWILTELNQQ
jgi:hypothetical protein